MPANFGVSRERVPRLFELGCRAIDAWIARTRATALAIPAANVAIANRLRTDAAEMLHHAADLGQVRGAGLVLVKLVLGAGMVHKVVNVEPWPGKTVELVG